MNPYQSYFQTPMYNPQMYHAPAPMDRLAQLQSQQISQNNQFMTIGKMVDSMDIVKATDIPMDGNMYYFPKADGSEIFVKQWLPNGTTQILRFKPFNDTERLNASIHNKELENEPYKALEEKIDSFSDRLDKMERYLKGKAKKEVVDE